MTASHLPIPIPGNVVLRPEWGRPQRGESRTAASDGEPDRPPTTAYFRLWPVVAFH